MWIYTRIKRVQNAVVYRKNKSCTFPSISKSFYIKTQNSKLSNFLKKFVKFCKDSDRKWEQMPSLSWMLMLVELDIGSIYPNPVLGFGKFWSIPNKIGTHFRMGFYNWMSLINHLSNAYVSSDGQPWCQLITLTNE